jgi:alpha-tubulin suppressor-like RCC1 family protein
MNLARRPLAHAGAAALLCLAAATAGAQILKPFPRPWLFPLPSGDTFVDITAGDHHTCARKLDGSVYCWGLNHLGQAGVASSRTCSGYNCVDRPRLVLSSTMQVDAGRDHTCALDTAGVARCWGVSNYGQLGAGSYGDSSATGPQTVPGRTFTSISAGQSSTCGNANDGVFCWGKIVNAVYGAPSPTLVFGWGGYQNLVVGHQHACAIYAAGSWREVDCFGNNTFGQTGTSPQQMNPVPAFTFTGLSVSANRAATQGDYTCVDQSTGIVQCAGYNTWGQLGNGTTGNSTHVASTVGGGMALSGVSTGPNHACSLGSSGFAYCWGNGYHGQVGVNPSNAAGVYPTAQAVGGGRSYRAIAAGLLHTCAIGTDNKIWCWGNNYYGQLGTQYPGGWVWDPVQALDP